MSSPAPPSRLVRTRTRTITHRRPPPPKKTCRLVGPVPHRTNSPPQAIAETAKHCTIHMREPLWARDHMRQLHIRPSWCGRSRVKMRATNLMQTPRPALEPGRPCRPCRLTTATPTPQVTQSGHSPIMSAPAGHKCLVIQALMTARWDDGTRASSKPCLGPRLGLCMRCFE